MDKCCITYAHFENNSHFLIGERMGYTTGKRARIIEFLSLDCDRSYTLEEICEAITDGIYFQSFTELNQDAIDGVLIAEAVTRFVNYTSTKLFERYPKLELQFGLHANSVKDKLEYIAAIMA